MEGGSGLATEDPELTRTKVAWLWEAGAHLMGRVTYEEMASYWPSPTHDYAAPMNEIPKVVFSSSIERADWPESRIARGDLAEEVAGLKREAGKDMIAWGGARFAQPLARLGLIDEYRLITHPVAVANGEPLFKDLSPRPASGWSRSDRSRAPSFRCTSPLGTEARIDCRHQVLPPTGLTPRPRPTS
jgi:dihydrofolate reductase